MTSAPDSSTVPGDTRSGASPDVTLRAALLVALVVLLSASALGWLGVSARTASATGDGFRLVVTYASVTRPGLATPFGFRLTRTDGSGLPERVSFEVDAAYLSMFDQNSLDPMPVASHADERWVIWTFDVPEGARELTVELDARLEPAVQARLEGASVTLVSDDDEVVAADFSTLVLP